MPDVMYSWAGTAWNKFTDPCTYLTVVSFPAQHVPILKDIVRKYGCDPKGQALGTVAVQIYANSQGGPLAGILAQVGAAIFYGCLCKKWQTELKLPPIQPPPGGAQQAGITAGFGIAAAAVGIAVALLFARGARKAPSVVAASPPPS